LALVETIFGVLCFGEGGIGATTAVGFGLCCAVTELLLSKSGLPFFPPDFGVTLVLLPSDVEALGDNALDGVLLSTPEGIFLGVFLNTEPPGNSKRKERSIIVITSL